jgi:N-acyl-D-aspartate/D-glutamate deacylase
MDHREAALEDHPVREQGGRADMYDLIIRGGRIVDGTGGPSRTGDVGVRDGWIVAVGEVAGPAKREIDARGLLVTPGFVDLHTHYDGQIIWSDSLSPSSDHGVTTILTGNCGIGFAPCRRGDEGELVSLMEGVEDIPEAVASAGLTWDWETFPQYMDAVERRAHDIEVAVLVPHSPLRAYVMGARGIGREAATPDDVAQMKALVTEAMDAGALGFGTSRAGIHRTSRGQNIPSYEAAEAELLGIAEALREAGRGVFQIVPNTVERSFEEEFAVIERVAHATGGRPVTYTQGQPAKGIDFIARLDAANAEPGVAIRAQMLPRPFGMIAGLTTSGHPFSMLPSWKPLRGLPLEAQVAAMTDPDLRARLIAEKPRANDIAARLHRRFENIFPIGPDAMSYEPARSESVASRAEREGRAPEEVAYDLLLEDGGRRTLLVALGNYNDFNLDFLEAALPHPHVVCGLGDGGAHYGFICDASYPTHALAHWTRDRNHGRFSVEQMVHLLSRRTAETIGLMDRGLIAPGHRADINIIDYERLRLHPPEMRFDLPAGGKRLHQRADGYVATLVGGVTIAENGEPTGARPGRLVRGAQQARAAV